MASKDDFIQLFRLADKDKSGHLTIEELFNQMRHLGYKGSDDVLKVSLIGNYGSCWFLLFVSLQSYFKVADVSKDAKLNLEEFVSSMSKAPPHLHR